MAKIVKKLTNNKKKDAASGTFFSQYKWEVLIFIFAALLYANSIPNNYNMDDELVTNNHRLTSRGISAIPEIFTSSYYKDEMNYAYEYRPVVLCSFAIEHQFFGDSPYVSHFFNVLLYALCCVLLYHVLLKVSGNAFPLFSVLATLFFVAHPAHTEVVCSIKNRDEMLSFFFSLLTFYLAFRATLHHNRWNLLILPLAFSFALMSKMTAISFALIIPIMLIFFTTQGFLSVMLISLLLSLPSFFLINNILTFYEKLIAVLLFLGAISVTFLMYHISISVIVQRIKQLTLWDSLIPNRSKHTYFRDNFKGIFTHIKVDSSIYSLNVIILSLIFGIFCFYGIAFNHSALLLLGALPLLIMAFNDDIKLLFGSNLVIYACFIFSMFYVNSEYYTLYGGLVAMILAYDLLYGSRKLFLPASIALLTFIIFNAITRWWSDFNVLISLFALRWKYGWPFLVVCLGVCILIFFLFGIYIGFSAILNINSGIYSSLASLVLIVLLLLNRGHKYLIHVFKLIIFILFIVSKDSNPLTDFSDIGNEIHLTIEEYGRNSGVNILPKEQDRPLLYLEQPVTVNDPWQVRAGTSMEILWEYFHKVVLPYPMAYYYGYKFIKPEKITDPIPSLSIILYFILGILTVVFVYKDRIIALGLIIYLVSIAAASNYFMPIPGQLGERFLLIPSLGWSIILAALLLRIFRISMDIKITDLPSLSRNAKYVFGTIMLLYSTITFARNFNWKDDITLFRHDIGYVDRSAQAHNLLASHLMIRSMSFNDQIKQQECWREALTHFKRSYQIYPDFYNVSFDLGRVFELLNEPDSAVFYFKRAISIDSTNSDAHLNVGRILIGQQKYAAAIPYFECFIRRYPERYDGYENLSLIYYNLREYQKSISVNKTIAEKLPSLPDPLINIAQTFLTMNQADSAYFYVQRSLQLDPNNTSARNLLTHFQKTQP